MKLNIFILVIITALFHYTIYTMDVSNNFKDMIDIQNKCFSLLRQLNDQPEMTHAGCWKEIARCKALPADFKISRATEIVCNAAKEQLGNKRAWHIDAVGCGLNQVTLPNENWMGDGLAKALYCNLQSTECSLEELKWKIRTIIKDIRQEWKKVKLSEYSSHIDFKYFSYNTAEEINNTFSLFIKPQIIQNEEIFFRCCLNILNLSLDGVENRGCGFYINNMKQQIIYLIIKKENVKKVLKSLRIHIK